MKNPIQSIKEKIAQYIQLRFELFRLEIIKKLASVLGQFFFLVFSFFFIGMILLFVFLGLSEVLAQAFDSRALGYFSTAGIILLLFLILMFISKGLIKTFANRAVSAITRKHDHDHHEE